MFSYVAPESYPQILSAIQQIEDVLVRANESLPVEYQIVGGTIFYNNPESSNDFPDFPIVVRRDEPLEDSVVPVVPPSEGAKVDSQGSFADLPDDVQNSLRGALGELGNIIISTNSQIPEEIHIVAGSIFYNNPAIAGRFASLSIVMPADVSFSDATDPSIVIPTDVAVYDPENSLNVRTLLGTYLTTGCVEQECCLSGNRRCKRRSLGAGYGYELRCAKVKNCPP
jgi:hypothetical protein